MISNLYAVIFAGLQLVYREYRDKPLPEMLAAMADTCEELEKAGVSTDHTGDVEAACIAAFQNETLRAVIDAWWWSYDQEREEGNIPAIKGTWEP